MFKNISPDSVRCGRICPANLGVRSCPVRKLICPVRSSPIAKSGSNKKNFNSANLILMLQESLVQEVPAFRDFWYQMESRNVKPFLVLNPPIGAIKILKSTFYLFLFTKFQFLKVKIQLLSLIGHAYSALSYFILFQHFLTSK